MSEHGHDSMEPLPRHVRLVQMATAYWASRLLFVAAKLGLADHLADGANISRERRRGRSSLTGQGILTVNDLDRRHPTVTGSRVAVTNHASCAGPTVLAHS
jgi:hypothetical protein